MKLVVLLFSKFTGHLHMLQNTSFSEKVRSPEVKNYFSFMRSTQGDSYMCSGKMMLKNNVF